MARRSCSSLRIRTTIRSAARERWRYWQRTANNIHIVIYTNDDKGSYDPDMTSERLAKIRMHEEEDACRILGIPKQNITWLEYHDGMLEYANTRDLVEEVTRIIRRIRPDVVMAIDPGSEYVRWHKTDHRMAANNTVDAIRAAEWHLYFPNQRLHEGLQPWLVPQEYYYYVTDKEANYWVNIDSVVDKEARRRGGACEPVGALHPSVPAGLGRRGARQNQGRGPRAHPEKRRPLRGSFPLRDRLQPGMKSWLVNELQCELNLPPWLRRCVRPRARRIEIVDQAVVAEIRMVGHVEELRPELQFHAFLHRKVFEQ